MQPDLQEIELLVANALSEDLGKGDITSELIINPDEITEMFFVARQEIIVCGLPVVAHVFNHISKAIGAGELRFKEKVSDGNKVAPGTQLASIKGNAREILIAERTALNIFQHMSGIATYAAQFVEAIKGTKAKILDTRKTLPGLREMQKYAVRTGGATNHRMRLDDGILIKDNHIRIAGGIGSAILLAKENLAKRMKNPGDKEVRLVNAQAGRPKIEVECDTIKQVEESLSAGADIILLDNMDIKTLKKSVELVAGKALLEASGGINLKTVRKIAETGVDFISVGALTHSAPATDIGLDFISV